MGLNNEDAGVFLDTQKKILKAVFSGTFSDLGTKASKGFQKAYADAQKTIKQSGSLSDYDLHIDSAELKPFPTLIVPLTKITYRGYTKFKNILVVPPKDEKAKNQMIKTWTDMGIMARFTFVEKLPS